MILAETVDSVIRLGPEWDALFASGPGLQSTRSWFQACEQAAMPAGQSAHIVTVREQGEPIAILPMQAGGAREITGMTSPYTVLFQPLLAAGVDPVRIGHALGRHLRRWPLIRLEALDQGWPGLEPLLRGFRRAGRQIIRFDHFGSWTETVAGLSWEGYLSARPGQLRETIRRRNRVAERDGTIRMEIVRGCDGLARAMAAYEQVYARSWKVPEPFPRFNAVFLPMAARLGVLRLAVMWRAEQPIAAQYWTVLDGRATVLKLAHDDAAKEFSPGTLLTAHVIRTMLAQERVTTLDFGRGDDAYKQLWTSSREQRIGLLLADPFRLPGLVEMLRHRVGQARRALRSGLTGGAKD